jgi:hypothetical protein
MIVLDAGKAAAGLLVSVCLAFGLPVISNTMSDVTRIAAATGFEQAAEEDVPPRESVQARDADVQAWRPTDADSPDF